MPGQENQNSINFTNFSSNVSDFLKLSPDMKDLDQIRGPYLETILGHLKSLNFEYSPFSVKDNKYVISIDGKEQDAKTYLLGEVEKLRTSILNRPKVDVNNEGEIAIQNQTIAKMVGFIDDKLKVLKVASAPAPAAAPAAALAADPAPATNINPKIILDSYPGSSMESLIFDKDDLASANIFMSHMVRMFPGVDISVVDMSDGRHVVNCGSLLEQALSGDWGARDKDLQKEISALKNQALAASVSPAPTGAPTPTGAAPVAAASKRKTPAEILADKKEAQRLIDIAAAKVLTDRAAAALEPIVIPVAPAEVAPIDDFDAGQARADRTLSTKAKDAAIQAKDAAAGVVFQKRFTPTQNAIQLKDNMALSKRFFKSSRSSGDSDAIDPKDFNAASRLAAEFYIHERNRKYVDDRLPALEASRDAAGDAFLVAHGATEELKRVIEHLPNVTLANQEELAKQKANLQKVEQTENQLLTRLIKANEDLVALNKEIKHNAFSTGTPGKYTPAEITASIQAGAKAGLINFANVTGNALDIEAGILTARKAEAEKSAKAQETEIAKLESDAWDKNYREIFSLIRAGVVVPTTPPVGELTDKQQRLTELQSRDPAAAAAAANPAIRIARNALKKTQDEITGLTAEIDAVNKIRLPAKALRLPALEAAQVAAKSAYASALTTALGSGIQINDKLEVFNPKADEAKKLADIKKRADIKLLEAAYNKADSELTAVRALGPEVTAALGDPTATAPTSVGETKAITAQEDPYELKMHIPGGEPPKFFLTALIDALTGPWSSIIWGPLVIKPAMAAFTQAEAAVNRAKGAFFNTQSAYYDRVGNHDAARHAEATAKTYTDLASKGWLKPALSKGFPFIELRSEKFREYNDNFNKSRAGFDPYYNYLVKHAKNPGPSNAPEVIAPDTLTKLKDEVVALSKEYLASPTLPTSELDGKLKDAMSRLADKLKSSKQGLIGKSNERSGAEAALTAAMAVVEGKTSAPKYDAAVKYFDGKAMPVVLPSPAAVAPAAPPSPLTVTGTLSAAPAPKQPGSGEGTLGTVDTLPSLPSNAEALAGIPTATAVIVQPKVVSSEPSFSKRREDHDRGDGEPLKKKKPQQISDSLVNRCGGFAAAQEAAPGGGVVMLRQVLVPEPLNNPTHRAVVGFVPPENIGTPPPLVRKASMLEIIVAATPAAVTGGEVALTEGPDSKTKTLKGGR